jgi:DNA-binding CsgD family transcriptional regulator
VAQAALLLFAAGRSGEGRELAQGALRELLPGRQQAEICLTMATMSSVPAQVRDQACRWALQLEGLSGPERLRLTAQLANTAMHVGEVAEARRILDAIGPDVGATGDLEARFWFAIARVSLALLDDRFADALAQAQALRWGSLAQTPMRAYRADAVIMESLALRDEFGQALQMVGTCIAAARRADQFWIERSLEYLRGRLWAAAGRLDDAAAALEGVSPTLEPYQVGNVADAATLATLGRVALHTGDRQLAETCARVARQAVAELPAEPRQHAAWLLASRLMADGDAAGARAVIIGGGTPDMAALPRLLADPADPPQLVRIALACGDDQLGAAAIALAEHRCRHNAGVASLEAIAAHARGLRSGDAAELTRAVELFTRSPRRLAMASAVEDLGRILLRNGQTVAGISRLSEALKLYAEMSATWDATRVRGRLRRVGVRRNLRPARPAKGWAGLTDSELAVVRLVAAGQTNYQIATQLYLSPHTVSTHLRHVFAKLEIRSRVELVRLFVSREAAATALVPDPASGDGRFPDRMNV